MTSMESSGLDDLLECSVCLEMLGQDHKVLPCQHTFCTRCLQDVADKHRQKVLADAATVATGGGRGKNQPQEETRRRISHRRRRRRINLSSSQRGSEQPHLICPECRSPCQLPLHLLPSNIILNRILESLKSGGGGSNSSVMAATAAAVRWRRRRRWWR
jgi:hypothetical protein